ncbi:sensor histidine kinase [bacterium 0.1xD8-71]|nr:sensor histidine kinase [bacterium 0.1xD8-71]
MERKKFRPKSTLWLLALFVVMIVIPTMTFLHYIIQQDIQELKAGVERQTGVICTQVNDTLEEYLAQLDRSIQTVYGKNMLNIMKDSKYSYTNFEEIQKRNRIEEYLSIMMNQSEHVAGIYVMTERDNLFYYSNYALNPDCKGRRQELLEMAGHENREFFVTGLHPSWFAAGKAVPQVISVFKPVYNMGGERLAVIVIDIEQEMLQELLDRYRQEEFSNILILGGDGQIMGQLYQEDYPEVYQEMEEVLAFPAPGQGYGTVNGQRALLSVDQTHNAGWKVVTIVYESRIQERIGTTLWLRRAVLFCILLWFVSFVIIGVKLIYVPLRKLYEAMELVKQGNMEAYIADGRRDEFGYLIQEYNRMLKQINELIYGQYVLELKNKEIKYKELKGRINPHFIINTMQLISSVAILNNDTETEELIRDFSGMLRYTLYEKDRQVPLSREIQHTMQFVRLREKNRDYGVTVQVEIPEECLDVSVMKLMLQPIVENCYFHGFTDKTRAYHILIKGERLERTLLLSVEDDGCGISQEKLVQIKDRLSAVCQNVEYTEKETDSIALDNIMGRLWTIYGEEAAMDVESGPGGGTRVTLRLPVQEA